MVRYMQRNGCDWVISVSSAACVQQAVTIDGIPVGDNEWFIINPKQIFFYRVDYDVNTRAAIVNQLLTDHTVITSYHYVFYWV